MIMIVIDEASMIPVHALQAIDRLLRELTDKDIPFGGKILLLGGDFRQVLPVIKHGSRTTIIESCLKRSTLWHHFKIIKLTQNMRARRDEREFVEWLLKLGNGKLKRKEDEDVDYSIEIPQCCVVTDDIVDIVFNETFNLKTTVILTPKNDASIQLNKQVLQKIPGETRIYYSTDKVLTDDEEESQNYPQEFLHSLTPSGMPEHRLCLKIGAIIMLLRNLDIQSGLCNGTRLVVMNMHDHLIEAVPISKTTQHVLIPRIKLAPSDANLPFVLERRQFPIRLAYCMTINKAQGQTFDKLGIYLPSPVFSHGQLYVAFSRARSFKIISIKVDETMRQGKRNNIYITQNIVYPEIL